MGGGGWGAFVVPFCPMLFFGKIGKVIGGGGTFLFSDVLIFGD